MKESKKPDQVVFNEETNDYDAAIKPYATNLGAPAISTNDTTAWKNNNIDKVNKHVKARYDELKSELDDLLQTFEYNKLVYAAKFSFEPIVGNRYHLYKDEQQQSFLSIISPEECNFDYIGSFRLNADKMWEKV
ncbi:MAG: DUF2452 domain-containing protein [Flavobacteriaceae bacterium]|nr:DUF2452 domain-containing protein [Flavobacteriaceae bacterium]